MNTRTRSRLVFALFHLLIVANAILAVLQIILALDSGVWTHYVLAALSTAAVAAAVYAQETIR